MLCSWLLFVVSCVLIQGPPPPPVPVRVLCRVLRVDPQGPPGEVLLALYLQTVHFCWRSGFSREQTSVLLSVMKRVHQLNTGEPVQVSGYR